MPQLSPPLPVALLDELTERSANTGLLCRALASEHPTEELRTILTRHPAAFLTFLYNVQDAYSQELSGREDPFGIDPRFRLTVWWEQCLASMPWEEEIPKRVLDTGGVPMWSPEEASSGSPRRPRTVGWLIDQTSGIRRHLLAQALATSTVVEDQQRAVQLSIPEALWRSPLTGKHGASICARRPATEQIREIWERGFDKSTWKDLDPAPQESLSAHTSLWTVLRQQVLGKKEEEGAWYEDSALLGILNGEQSRYDVMSPVERPGRWHHLTLWAIGTSLPQVRVSAPAVLTQLLQHPAKSVRLDVIEAIRSGPVDGTSHAADVGARGGEPEAPPRTGEQQRTPRRQRKL